MSTEREQAYRLFVACLLPPEVIAGLARVQDDLRRAIDVRLRYVRPEGIHITLRFLGNVAPQRVDAITSALRSAIQPFELRLEVDHIGGFGGNRIRAVWAGLAGDVDALTQLAGRVDAALEPAGFAREQRPFAPHLTLARVPDEASPEDRRLVNDAIRAYKFPSLPPILVSGVVLMRSHLGAGGARYEQLVSFPAKVVDPI